MALFHEQTASQSRTDISQKDQAKEIEELKTKLAASQAKERDFGMSVQYPPFPLSLT
jgi:B-cell receptor-associated protein 31